MIYYFMHSRDTVLSKFLLQQRRHGSLKSVTDLFAEFVMFISVLDGEFEVQRYSYSTERLKKGQ